MLQHQFEKFPEQVQSFPSHGQQSLSVKIQGQGEQEEKKVAFDKGLPDSWKDFPTR
jgi:hypothetical protein